MGDCAVGSGSGRSRVDGFAALATKLQGQGEHIMATITCHAHVEVELRKVRPACFVGSSSAP